MRTLALRLGPVLAFVLVLLIYAAGQDPAAEVRAPRRVSSFEHINQELMLKCDVGTIIVKAWADAAVHVRYYPRSTRITLPLWGILPLAASPKYRVDSTPEAVMLSTSLLTVSVERATARLSFLDQKQNPLLVSGPVRLESAGDDYRIHAAFEAPQDECYYGLGWHPDGFLDQRGRTVRVWHDAQQDGDAIAIPFLVTNRRYGLLMDNASKITAVPGKEGRTTWNLQSGDALSYFFVFGNTPDDIYRGYRTLTGATPLPPRAALGFVQGAPRNFTPQALLQLARDYRDREYPVDFLIAGPGAAGSADPAGAKAELEKAGLQVVASVEPRVPAGSPRLESLLAMGCTPKDQDASGGLLDVSKASCAAWFWNNIQEAYPHGFRSWMLNSDRPDLLAEAVALNGGTGARLFNVFPMLQAKAVFDGQRKDLKERCLVLSRWGYLGAQRFGVVLGAPESPAQWKALASGIAAGLNLSASGIPWWSSAIGGQSLSGGIAGDDYTELFCRWLEFAAFTPVFRAGAPIPSMEPAVRVASRYLSLRYRLLPYTYSLARAASETGAPLARPLFMDFGQDPETRDLKDEYMFGPAFLVAPVLDKGRMNREVYLPKGTAWYDYWTGKKFAGGQRITVEAPIDVLPLFVRAGSVIPHGNAIASTREDQRQIELRVYAGANGRFDLYQDDGATYGYEKGAFSLAQIRWTDATQTVTVTGDDRKILARPLSPTIIR